MEYIMLATFLLMFGAANSQEYIPSRMKEIPEAPKLANLNYNKLPEYVRHLIAPAELKKENNKNSKSTTLEGTQIRTPKTYGMSIINDHGFVWNDLTKPRTFYEVGETEHKENNEDQKETNNQTQPREINSSINNNLGKVKYNNITGNANTDKEINEFESIVHKKEDILNNIVEDNITPKYDQPTTYKPISQIAIINNKNGYTNTTARHSVNIEEPKTNNFSANRTEKLMQDIEKAIHDFVGTLNNSVTQDLSKKKKPSDYNSTSDEVKIPLSELQSIFDDIIKNYSSPVNSNMMTIEDNSNKPNTLLNSNETSNTGLGLLENQTIIETTPNILHVGSDMTKAEFNPTTEIIIVDKDITNEFESTDVNSNVKELDDSKDSNQGLTENCDNEKGNNDALNNQMRGFNATNLFKQLIDDETFQQLVNDSTAKFLEPFIEHLEREIKDKVTTELQDYFRSIKSESNQPNPTGNCPNESNNITYTAEREQIKDTNDSIIEESTELFNDISTENPTTIEIEPTLPVDKTNSKLPIHSNESYTDKYKAANETSTESSLIVNPMPQNIFYCEACKVIFNLKLNGTPNYINRKGGDTNDRLFIKNSKENSSSAEISTDRIIKN